MQSWGDESKYEIRQTWQEPSKSGVIGLLAAACGLRRDSDEVAVLASSLRMGVRVDMPGQVVRDYHTAHAPKHTAKGDVRHETDGTVMIGDAYITHRYYLCDACFLVGLESEDEALLTRLEKALAEPCFPLYLGRRACPPVLPLCLGIKQEPLDETLRGEPWQAPEWYRRKHPIGKLRMILETRKGEAAWHTLRDTPVSFSPIHRRYAPRGLRIEQKVILRDESHDPMAEL